MFLIPVSIYQAHFSVNHIKNLSNQHVGWECYMWPTAPLRSQNYTYLMPGNILE